MKLAFWQHLTVLTVLGLGATNFSSAALAAQFEQQEIDQSRFIVLAAPGGDIGYKLLILEQINSNRPCWSETGSSPSNVDPLLLNFDFTGICNRLVDSNSFSVRTAGEDQALQYSLRIIKRDNDLVLVAASNTDRNALVEIGRTNGLPTGFSRIVLNPGWRLTRRAFNGRALGHVYLTYDQPMEVLVASSRRNVPLGNQSPTTIPNTPSDLDSTDLDSTETLNTPSDAVTPDVTAPRPTDTSPADTSVIPVPSLPPAISTTPAPDRTTPAPLPPLGTTRPTTPPRTGTAPNLSTILPRPSATTNQSSTQTPTQPTQSSSAAQPGTSGANDRPILPPPPPVLTAPDSGSTSTSSTGSGSTSTGSTTSTSRTTSPPSSRTSSSASGRSTTAQPTGVPQVSNSGGAPLRPRSLRREESPTSQTGQASSGTSRSNPSNSARSTSSGTASNSAIGGGSSGSSTTVAQAETYQVIVVADSAEAQDKVREIVPDAFLTTINGQVVMQAGVFQDRQEADQLQQRLSLEGLSTAVISVR